MRAGDAAAPLELAFWGETPEPHTVPALRCQSDASPELDPAKIDDRLFPSDRCGLAKAPIAERWKRCLRGQPAEASADNYDPWPARREGGGTIVSMRSNIPSMLGLARRDQSGGVTAQLSGAELVGEFRKPVHDYVGRGVGYGIGRAGGSPLVGSAHKGSAIADAAGRIEVEIVARHHQDLVRLDGQKCGSAPIGIGVRLVNAQHLAG